MKVRRSLVAIAAGAILATAGIGYSAPAQHYYGNTSPQGSYGNNNSSDRGAEQRGGPYGQGGERFEENNYRRGEAMEGRRHQFLRGREGHEWFGAREDWDDR